MSPRRRAERTQRRLRRSGRKPRPTRPFRSGDTRLAAGLTEIDAIDVERMRGDVLACRQAEHAEPWLVCMLAQAMTIERAIDQGGWAGLVDAYPELSGARRALGCEPSQILELLERYVSDWRALPSPLVSRFLAPAAGVS